MTEEIPKVKIKVGDRFLAKLQPENFVFEGEVVYIHPSGRFYTMEFTMESGKKVRESYQLVNGCRFCHDRVTPKDILDSQERRKSWGGLFGQRSDNEDFKLCS